MNKVMTAQEFADRLIDTAKNYKTLYIKGCIGAPMNEKNKKRYTTNCDYNKRADRKKKIEAASADTFGFDCVCLCPKSILWGWCGDVNATYGGAVPESNGVPDWGTEKMIGACADVSEDFDSIAVGELVWMKGHVGAYVGDGLVVECSPKWKDGAQITACNRDVPGYNRRNWKKHGKLPWVDYGEEEETVDVKLDILKKGAKGEQVKTLQRLLLMLGYSMKGYGVDGSFGGATETAVKTFQKNQGLTIDGSVGKATWDKMLKG